ncbi:MAG: zinc finger Ran-binding domain-containing protein [Armatimonadetes bacterium]|nr:zinc finger Ran-binding domain-containing protein [Armatimonadota bacterium]
MASKKCPKCGEDNPAEAVMCWACYTPLSGSAATTGIAGAAGLAGFGGTTSAAQAPVGVPAVEEAPKKGVDPKLVGIVAFLLIGGVVAFLVNGGMSGGSGPVTADTALTEAPADPNAPPPPPVAAPPPLSVAPSSTTTAPPAPVPVIFTTVTAPNPKFETGVVGVLVPPAKAGQATGAAKFVRDQFSRNGSWTRMQVVVFADSATADAFRAYQGPRGGRPLDATSYQQLSTQGVWTNTLAFLESSGKKEVMHYPSRNPNGWWGR